MTLNTEILADSPDFYYRLGESSGTVAADSSAAPVDGAYVSSPTLGVASLDGSSSDTCAEFDLGQHVTFTNGSVDSGAFTWEALIRFDDLGPRATGPHSGVPFAAWYSGTMRDYAAFWSDKVDIMIDSGIAPTITLSGDPLVSGETYHVVVRRNAANLVTIWINGVNRGSTTRTGNANINKLGANWTGFGGQGFIFNGAIDEAAIYQGVELSDARIAAHYAAAELLSAISISVEITVEAETGILHIDLEQRVYEVGSLSIGLQQTVTENTGTISIILEQSVYEVGSLSIALSQVVYDTAATPSPSWTLTISVGGIDFSGVLTGRVEVGGSEQESTLAQFTIKPAFGSIDIYEWVNKRVTIDYTSGITTRIYSGIVDRPVYDPNTGLTTFYCTDAMQNTFNNLNNEQIDSLLGGYHSKHIFTGDARGWDYAKEHLSTLTKAFDLDANNAGRLTDWAAKATPDFTFTESDILDKSLRVDLAKRDKVHNTHNITFQYRFQRLRERVRSYTWVYPLGFPTWLTQSTTLPTKTMIRDSVTSAGWTMASESYVNPPKSAAVSLGFGATIYWNIAEDIRQELLFSALFSMKKRWVQTVTEEYSINLFANQSVEKLGEIKQASQFSVSSSEDAEGWTDYSVTPAGVSSVTANNDAVIDVTSGEVSRTDADNAVTTIQARAKAELLQSHRQNEVRYSTLLNPYIDRTHTAQVSTTPVTAKGKVKAYKHEFNLLSGSAITDIALALSKSQAAGIPTATPIAPPVEADKTDPIAADPAHVVLDTHIGGQQNSPAFDEAWTGFLGNNALTAKKTFKNKSADPGSPAERDQEFSNVYPGSAVYPYAFRVPAPAIETLLTDSLEAKEAVTVEIAIPEDTLIMAA